MKFIKSLFSIKPKASEISGLKGLDTSKEFKDSSCRCVQQELDISEIQWMDTSAYQNAKRILRKKSVETINARIDARKQKDLFGY